MTAVHTCSKSERSSGRYPQILLHQQSPSQSWIPWREASVGSEVVFWIISWWKPGGRWIHCLPGHCQSGWGWSCYSSRNLQMAHQTTGHPHVSEEVGIEPNVQRSPLTILTESPVWVRFMLNSQSNERKSQGPGLYFWINMRPNCCSIVNINHPAMSTSLFFNIIQE